MNDETSINANKVFLRYLKGRDTKLTRALADRERNRKLLDSGKVPEGNDRYDWLVSSTLFIFDVMTQRMEEYDKEHPGDCITSKDLCDLFITCLSRLGVDV